MFLFRILIGVWLSVCCSYAIAQDSLLYITSQTIEITARKLDITDHELDLGSNELVEALTNTSAIHVQSNGPGLLATPLIHGFGARHTALLWHEFNIQSPINGTFDLNLLTGFDKINYTDKSLSASLGTASLGGAIVLHNPTQPKLTRVKMSANSIENLKGSATHSFQLSKLKSQISLSAINSNNAFDYKWAGEINKWLTEVKGSDLKWNNEYQFHRRLILSNNIWISKFNRELPSSLVSASEPANQIDNNYRYHFSLAYTSDRYSTKLGYAHFDEQLNYKTAGVDSRAKNKVNALNFSISTGKHNLNLSHRIDRADANFFNSIHTRQLSTISYRYNHKWSSNLSNQFTFAKQLLDRKWSPLLFDFNTTYSNGKFIADITVNSSYNTPTLNDLYWPQGGNPNLLPEQSYGLDLGLKYLIQKGTFLSLNPFYKNVSNWILWTPGERFWSPKNQRSVLSKGFDFNIDYRVNQSLSSGISLTYTDAKITKEITFKELEGNQLLYIPKVKSSLWVNYRFKKFQLRTSALYVSRRYTTTDNASSIPGFTVIDLQLLKQIKLKTAQSIDIGITVFNLLNEDYQQVEFYPMPLRNFELNINYKINRK